MKSELQEVINTFLAVEKRIISVVNDRSKELDSRLLRVERTVNDIKEAMVDLREYLDARLD